MKPLIQKLKILEKASIYIYLMDCYTCPYGTNEYGGSYLQYT